MIKFLTCLFLVNSLFIGTITAQNSEELFKTSKELYKVEKYKKSLAAINKALKETPTRSEFYSFKGEILYAINKDINEFFSYLSEAIKVEPNSPAPLMIRATYYEQIAEHPNAILDYNDALKLATDDSTKVLLYTIIGGVYQKVQKPKIAYEKIMMGYNIDSNNVGVLNNLAMCLDDLNRRDESRKYLLKIIEIDSTFIGAYVNLGFQASLNEEFDLALEYLNKADHFEPNQAITLNNRGYAKFKLGDFNGALNDINTSIKLNPTNSYAFRNKALVYLEKKDFEKACENLYSSKNKGFGLYYGPEIDELIKKHCIK